MKTSTKVAIPSILSVLFNLLDILFVVKLMDMGRVLDYRQPLVRAFHLDSGGIGGGLSI